jgi:hypothetical protein
MRRMPMHLATPPNSIPESYPLGVAEDAIEAGLAGPALLQILAAWVAVEALETDLPGGPDRWQAESLFVAREGMRRALLALYNLARRLRNGT